MNLHNQKRLRRWFNTAMAELKSTSQDLREGAAEMDDTGRKEAQEALVKSADEWDHAAMRIERNLINELRTEGVTL